MPDTEGACIPNDTIHPRGLCSQIINGARAQVLTETIRIEYRKYKRGSLPITSPVPGEECAGTTGRAAEMRATYLQSPRTPLLVAAALPPRGADVPVGPPPTTRTLVSAKTGMSRATSWCNRVGRGRGRRERFSPEPKPSMPCSSPMALEKLSSLIAGSRGCRARRSAR